MEARRFAVSPNVVVRVTTNVVTVVRETTFT
jgi:hypothetical protein